MVNPAGRDPIVLVSDPLTVGEEWVGLRPLLASSFEPVDLALPPSPRAGSPDDGSEVDLAGALEALGVVPAHVLARGFAAAPVIRLAARRPDLFRSLLLIEPIVRLPATGPSNSDTELDRLLAAPARAVERDHPEEAASTYLWLFGEEAAPADSRGLFTRAFKNRGNRWLAELRSSQAWTVPAAAEEFLSPALVVDGELSPGFVHRQGEEIARRFPNVVHLRLPGAGHLLPFREPARLAGVLMTFCLERNISPA